MKDAKEKIADRQRAAIKRIMAEYGLSVNGWTKKAKISEGALRHFLSGTNNSLGGDKIEMLANAIGKTASELLSNSSSAKVAVLGYVGAGGQVYPINDLPIMPASALMESEDSTINCEFVDAPPGVSSSEIACVKVRGHSMHPVYKDGEYLFYRRTVDFKDSFIGEDCIVELQDGRLLLKTLRRGLGNDKFNLDSYSEPPIVDVSIRWAAPIEWIKKNVRH